MIESLFATVPSKDPSFVVHEANFQDSLDESVSPTELKTLIELADALINSGDLDTLLHRAVELARQKLHLDRCSIFLHQNDALHGTYGTDLTGQTTDEHTFILPIKGKWRAQFEHWKDHQNSWMAEENVPMAGPGASSQTGTVTWAAVTPIKGLRGRVLAVFCNDSAIRHLPLDAKAQNLLAVYCSLLGGILERQFSLDVLSERDQALEGLARISHKLLTGDNYDGAIQGALAELGSLVGGHHAALLKKVELAQSGMVDIVVEHAWQIPGVPRLASLRDFLSLFRQQETTPIIPFLNRDETYTTVRSHAPPSLRARMEAAGMVSMAVAPLYIRKDFWGFLFLGDIDKEQRWTGPARNVIQSMISSFTGVIARRDAERTLRNRDATLSGVAEAIHCLITTPSFDEGIQGLLHILARALHVERTYIFQNATMSHGDDLFAHIRYFWSQTPGDLHLAGPSRLWSYKHAFPGWHNILSRGCPVRGHVMDVLPETSRSGSQSRVRSILYAPITIDTNFWGFIGFDDSNPERIWDEGDMSILTTMAGTIGGAISKKMIEHSLRDRETRFRTLIENASDMILEINQAGILAYASPSLKRILGYHPTSSLGGSLFNWIHLDDQLTVLDAIAQAGKQDSEQDRIEFRTRHENGSWRWIESALTSTVNPNGLDMIILNSRDITERKESEEALKQSQELLLHSQKMDAIGRLAGGVAHDFNNLLTVILGYGDMITRRLEGDDPIKTEIEEICKAAGRAHALTRQLLAFSRKQIVELRRVNVNQIVREIDTLLHRLVHENIKLETDLAPDAGSVKVDPAQMEQAIINLALNGRDAMPAGGVLTISTRNVTLQKKKVVRQTVIPPGDYVEIRVMDTGEGMTQEVLSHVFEPFFTTKEIGRGSGLGLSMVYGTVNQSDGHILLDSVVRRGTTVSIWLPRVYQLDQVTVPPEPVHDREGSETILLVEDEDTVRELARRILQFHGYHVLVAANGVEGLTSFKAHADEIDMVFTDIIMPQMSGPSMVEAIHALRPGVPALFMSGYAQDSVVDSEFLIDDANFVQKPFTPDVLYRKIREMLDRSPLKV